MKLANIRSFLGVGPLIILAFTGCTIDYLNKVFTSSTRWACLGLSLILLSRIRGWTRPFTTAFGAGTLAFVFWVMLTYFWSEIPSLTLMKGSALLMLVLAGMGGGAYWVMRKPLISCLDCLAPMTAVGVITGLFGGVVSPENAWNSSEIALYKGMAGNSNMMGIISAMSIPFPLWRAFVNWSQPKARLRWGAVVCYLLGLALLAGSRSSILAIMCISLGFLSGIGLSRSRGIVIFFGAAVIASLVVFPQFVEMVENRLIYKVHDSSDDIKKTRGARGALASRDETWETSYAQAEKGGLFGGGYGVTIGDTGFDASELRANSYGREKGNSQLGIIEEVGIIGFLLYVFSTLVLLHSLWNKRNCCHNRQVQVLFGIVMGTLSGMVVNSMFEAWYNAPGSAQCAYYWVIAGVAVGLMKDQRLMGIIKHRSNPI